MQLSQMMRDEWQQCALEGRRETWARLSRDRAQPVEHENQPSKPQHRDGFLRRADIATTSGRIQRKSIMQRLHGQLHVFSVDQHRYLDL